MLESAGQPYSSSKVVEDQNRAAESRLSDDQPLTEKRTEVPASSSETSTEPPKETSAEAEKSSNDASGNTKDSALSPQVETKPASGEDAKVLLPKEDKKLCNVSMVYWVLSWHTCFIVIPEVLRLCADRVYT